MTAKRVAVINGPNLNLLGTRQPEIYGRTTLADVETALRAAAAMASVPVEIEIFQSNHEGALIDRLHECCGRQHDSGFRP